jgi:thiol:disulfide interchange protein
MKRLFIQLLLISVFYTLSFSQVINPVKWDFSSKKINENTAELKFTAIIDNGWHMYGINIPPDGPVATSFTFENENELSFMDNLHSIQKPIVKFDSTFEMTVELFDKKADFIRKINIIPGKKIEVKGRVTFMTCDDSRCLPPKDENFRLIIDGTEIGDTQKEIVTSEEPEAQVSSEVDTKNDTNSTALTTNLNNIQDEPKQPIKEPKEKLSLWKFILKALAGGFLAVITPCVYPIIPLTVSYFMRETSRRKALANAILFGASIVFIYTMIGFITGLTRFDIAYWIKTQQLPNIIFFLLFLILAASFFGAFELVLPSKLTNKIDQRADKGGFLGPFFMALATVFVSFSCVGPIAGIILGDALRGEILTPVVGMFAFSLAFSLPFTLLAIFPGFMKNLPKSGGWLNSVKVFFAFILLAFSMVFITNLQLTFFTRDVALAIEIVIFILLGIYFLGKIKFTHDSDLPHLSVTRLLLAIASFSFAVYMVPGIFGAPLKAISPFLPAKEEMAFDLTKSVVTPIVTSNVQSVCNYPVKYSGLYIPLGLRGYFDYDEALKCAKQLKKPVLLDFAGHSCKNCKKMYAEVWSDPRVLKLLNENFVIAVLYTDDNTILAKEDMVVSAIDNQLKNTIGKKFNALQIEKFKTNTLPLYAIVNPDGLVITDKAYHEYSPDIDSFIDFLKNGIEHFRNLNMQNK